MYITNKSQPAKLLSFLLALFFLTVFTSPAAAVDLPFDPNLYDFLIYNPEGREASIVEAMEHILGRQLDQSEIRSYTNPVTSSDIAENDILIVGWNDNYGDISGLDEEILAAGITGRVILSGHDADYHTVKDIQAAEVFLVQAIDWVLKGDGTGLITLGCVDAFPYLPEFWDVNAYASGGQDVNEFTEEGLASGVYDGLEPNDMGYWQYSYHDIFTIGQVPYFVPFELGGNDGNDIITIASYEFKLPYFDIHKDDNEPNCVLPGDYITYKITYGPKGVDHNNVVITDYLPCQVDYINPFDPNYDDVNHTYKWQIGSLSASAPNDFVTLTVIVNLGVEPNGIITNYCEIESDLYFSFALAYTNVCFWSPDIIYVDLNAVGCNSGLSWYHADLDLQSALKKAQEWDVNQIWVADGTYKPTKGSFKSISFGLLDGVAIYGGFAGSESHPNQRDLTDPNNGTILSGDIAMPNYHNDNSYHVVKCVDVNKAVLDGFTITAGNADFFYSDPCCGGGIYNYNSSSLRIRNCTFIENSAMTGGGLYNYQSSPTLINCTFSGNSAIHTWFYSYGGGIGNHESSPTIISCTFSGNSATTGVHTYGGAIYNWDSSDPNISNCIFTNNSAYIGGAIYNGDYSDPHISNCIFSNNSACDGGAVYNDDSEPNITYCIFTANNAFDYGGAVYSSDYSPKIANSIFTGNKANDYGGAMYNYNCYSATVTNCIFSGNRANYGGGISNDYSGANLTNCTFSENRANNYGGCMFIQLSEDVNVTNCIFWDNEAAVNNEIYKDASSTLNVTYSDVKDWSGGGDGNIDKDPCFFDVQQSGTWSENASYDNSIFQSTLTDSGADWAVNELAGKFINPDVDPYQYLQFFIVSNNVNTIKVWSDVTAIAGEDDPYQIYDYHLTTDSPCIDAGHPNFNPEPNMTDIDGEHRVVDGDANGTEIVDMGADEYYWSPADINSDGFVNFFDYTFFASAWQSEPNYPNYNEDCDLEDNNSIDYNDIALFCKDWLWQTAWAKVFPSAYDEGLGRSMGMGMGEPFSLAEGLYSSKQAQPELTAEDIEEILKWLEDLWLKDDEVRKMITVDEWLKFIESVKQAAKEQIYN